MVGTEKSVYYVRGGRKYEVFSERVLKSWELPILKGSEVALSKTPRGKGYLGFRDGTIVQDYSTGRVYLISGNKKRWIRSPDVYEKYGLDEDRVIFVSSEEVELHSDGKDLL